MARNMVIIDEILKCETTDEVNSVLEDINMALKSVRGTISSRKKMEFSVGDTVMVTEKNGSKSEGELLKINRTRAQVKMKGLGISGLTYAVPFSIMEKA